MAYGRGGGMGGAGMQNLMKQAQKMQEEMQAAEQLLEEWEIVGTAGGEAVVVYMNAKKKIDGIEIDKEVIDPEDSEMLEDLVLAAILDGYKKADEVYKEKMAKFGAMGGGLGGGLGGLL
ncbi:MAG: YbaB/EbfC family nucleoid-associated protein [Clostridia bacterium]|nr:YbaB/EbfC family nucleoid-associated protein [Clostridia bacterium]